MVRPNRRKIHNRKISYSYREKTELQRSFLILNSLNFVFSIVALGLHYTKTAVCFLLNNIRPPKKSSFYKQQHKVIDCLCNMACESMNYYAKKTRKNDVVSVDGAWDHRREGSECQAVFINQRLDKVVGSFNGVSSNMEREAIRRAIPQMRTLKFNGYVHDKNKSITNVFMNNWSELDEQLDPNHIRKSLGRKIDKYNLLKDLKGRLLKWFNILIKKNLKPKKMTEQWMNAEKHYSGDHFRCEKHGQSNDWTGKTARKPNCSCTNS